MRILKKFFFAPDSPLNVAVFRIAVCVAIFFTVDVENLGAVSHLSEQLIWPPRLLDWAVPLVLAVGPYLSWLGRALQLTSLLGAFGLMSRSSMALSAVLATFVFGVPCFYGKIFNLHQQLVWFSIILAAGDCGARLSLDSLIKKIKLGAAYQPPSGDWKYSITLKTAWLLYAAIYFFPGFHKARELGLDWIFTDHLRDRFYSQWFLYGYGRLPFFRVDQYPFLMACTAATVLVFELTIIAAIFWPRARVAYGVAALVFQTITHLYLHFAFYQLRTTLVVFFDWSRKNATLPVTAPNIRSQRFNLAVCATVLLAEFTFGALRIRSWPFSVFPIFTERYGTEITYVNLRAVDKNNVTIDLGPALWKLVLTLEQVRWRYRLDNRMLSADDGVVKKELEAVWSELVKYDLSFRQAKKLQLILLTASTIPEESSRNPLSRRLRYELDLTE